MNWTRGQQVDNGRYEIVDRIGTGEFGSIYKAIDLKTVASVSRLTAAIRTYPRPNNENIKSEVGKVTIETIDEKYQCETSFEQFQEKLCDRTRNHNYYSSHLLAVDRVFCEDKTWAVATTDIEADTLENYIVDRGILAEDKAVEIIQKIGYAVSYERLEKLLHRDIKTSNIIISRSSKTPTLIDFGLDELVVDSAKKMNSISPFYLEPEKTEHGGDSQYIYALAATLYTCLTGNIPPSSEMRIIQDSLIPPQQLNPQISGRINRVILNGMALKLKDRSSSLEEWLSLMPSLRLDEQELLGTFRRGQRNFYKLDMSDLQLPNTSLYSINLFDVNFTRSNFKEANFSRGKFERVDFSDSVFRNAILSKASFTHTNLQNADLRGAYLDDTELNNTNLQGANLCGANLKGAKISEENLKQSKTNFLTIFPNGKRGGWL